jgi:sugar (pentulose or hexulose) kinase
MRYLAIDLGASSGRTIVGEISDGSITLTETHRFHNGFVEAPEGRVWEFDRLLNEIKTGIAKSGEVGGIGLDTWGVDFGYIDADGKVIGQPMSYRDTRHEAMADEVFARISKARLYEISGIQFITINSIFQLMADILQRPEVVAKAHRLLFIPELFMQQLTGTPVVEYTIASTSGMLDAGTRTWSDEIIEALGAPRKLFLPVDLPGNTVGDYQGTPVYLTACHDTGSAVAAVPTTSHANDWCYISSGTWSLVGSELPEPILTAAAESANFTHEGGVEGKIRFLKNVIGLWLIQECQRLWKEAGNPLTFAEIADAAAASDFAAVVNPTDSRFLAPDNMLETLASTCAENGQPVPESVGDYARCCYQSLARAYATVISDLAGVTGQTFNCIHVVGGGAQAKLLNQLTADHCGIPVHAGPVEATAIGNIIVQAMAQGEFADLASARRAVAAGFPVDIYTPRG